MIELPNRDNCSGCGLCSYVCKNKAIVMSKDITGSFYPVVDNDLCVSCNRCMKFCPSLNPCDFNEISKIYAAWSNDENERRSSASGGLAFELYRYCKEEKFELVGAKQNKDFSVSLYFASSDDDVVSFKNSKYVFSEIYDLYPKLQEKLSTGVKCLVIGLPCQIAAIKKVFGNFDNLYLVDLVCHGIAPYSYLKQYIEFLEKQYDEKTECMSFRDPQFKTCTYTFSLYNHSGNLFYKMRTKEGDLYQFGYHRMITYRPGCYNCSYATLKRLGDLTLADYCGMDENQRRNVSALIVNTSKGQTLVDSLIRLKRISVIERPICEHTNNCGMMHRPSPRSKYSLMFDDLVRQKDGDFVESIIPVYELYCKENSRLSVHNVVNKIKKVLSKLYK